MTAFQKIEPLMHDYVSTACVHRDHEHCIPTCFYCGVTCLCVCHRWPIPVPDVAVEDV